jgi:hypothetical protein
MCRERRRALRKTLMNGFAETSVEARIPCIRGMEPYFDAVSALCDVTTFSLHV